MTKRNDQQPPTGAFENPVDSDAPIEPNEALLALSRELGVLVGRRLASQENEKSPRAGRAPLAQGRHSAYNDRR